MINNFKIRAEKNNDEWLEKTYKNKTPLNQRSTINVSNSLKSKERENAMHSVKERNSILIVWYDRRKLKK